MNAVKNRLLEARARLSEQAEALSAQGLNLEGLVPAMTYMLETMSSSVIVPREISLAVSAQSGITCISGESEAVINDPFISRNPANNPAAQSPYQQNVNFNNVNNNPPAPAEDEDDGYDDGDDDELQSVHRPEKMSPTVKILIGIICVLVVAIGVIAVVIFTGHKKEDTTKPDSAVTTAAETTTKKKETTTKEKETTTVAETTTKAPETTTKAPETTTKAPETTTQVSIRVTENKPPVNPDPGENNGGDNEPENPPAENPNGNNGDNNGAG